jgi:hypothetical protein
MREGNKEVNRVQSRKRARARDRGQTEYERRLRDGRGGRIADKRKRKNVGEARKAGQAPTNCAVLTCCMRCVTFRMEASMCAESVTITAQAFSSSVRCNVRLKCLTCRATRLPTHSKIEPYTSSGSLSNRASNFLGRLRSRESHGHTAVACKLHSKSQLPRHTLQPTHHHSRTMPIQALS